MYIYMYMDIHAGEFIGRTDMFAKTWVNLVTKHPLLLCFFPQREASSELIRHPRAH